MIAPTHAAADADRVAGRRRSFDPLAYWIAWLAGRPRARSGLRVRDLLAELRLRLRRGGAGACPAAPRPAAARSAGARQLSPGRTARHGGMGEVWRAEHRLLARERPSSWCGPRCSARATRARRALMLKRFEREAQATAALSSPHTIQVFDFGITQDGTFYYVMELLDRPRPRVAGARVRAAAGQPRASTCCARCATRWPTPTRAASCTATSSRPTSMSAAWASSTTSRRCSTSAWSRSRQAAAREPRRC